MKKFDPKSLPYLASLTTAVMITRAAVEYFGPWGWIIGPLAGMVSSLSLAVAGSKISDIAAKRKTLAHIALGLMMILSPMVIYFSEDQPTEGMIVWAILPDAAILLASVVTGQSLVARPEQVAPQGEQAVGKKKGKKQKLARKSVTEDELLAYLLKEKNASQQQVADHFGVTRSAIGQRMAKLKAQGKIK